MSSKQHRKTRDGQGSYKVVHRLVFSDLEWLGRAILKILRLKWRDEPVQPEQAPRPKPSLPTGPYALKRRDQRGDLLLFVPRGWNSLLIDDVTGRYGYSHATIDCGEVDLPTGKPVMVESTIRQPVQRRFIDQYGQRHFVRIPLSRAGVDVEQFCDCVQSKLGEPYDNLEALTWGMVDDPAKQVCTDLATVCLPEQMRSDIARRARLFGLRRRSVSVYSLPGQRGTREFISPNGFAEYFGAPQGEDLARPDTLAYPRAGQAAEASMPRETLWKFALFFALLAGLWLLVHPKND